MAQTKKRQASTLTLAAQSPRTATLILRALGDKTPANGLASMARGLAVPLAGRLADCAGLANEPAVDDGPSKSGRRGGQYSALEIANARVRKLAAPRAYMAIGAGRRDPRQPGPILREPGAIQAASGAGPRIPLALGCPLSIHNIAEMLGCSPWTVRQTLIPRGLPHFRFRAGGRLTFYRDQVIRWVENQQGGNTTS